MALPCHVAAFFYLWYGVPLHDGKYLHWDHAILPHWTKAVNAQYPSIGTRHDAANGQLHSRFYPQGGAYSSRHPATLDRQFDAMASAGVQIAVLSWWGQAARKGTSDTQGVSTDAVIHLAIQAAELSGRVQVAFHLEPYEGRSAGSVAEDVQYLERRFGNSSALQRIEGRPVYYVYDSYHVASMDWKAVLPKLRGYFVALWLDAGGGAAALAGGFDAVYTYFGSDGFSYGSSSSNWESMAAFAAENALGLSLSVGPGYDDSGIRPWNAANTKSREGGAYYARQWASARSALGCSAMRRHMSRGGELMGSVSITSWNEWGEGTQIEAAEAREGYQDYGRGMGPAGYLDATKRQGALLCAADQGKEL